MQSCLCPCCGKILDGSAQSVSWNSSQDNQLEHVSQEVQRQWNPLPNNIYDIKIIRATYLTYFCVTWRDIVCDG